MKRHYFYLSIFFLFSFVFFSNQALMGQCTPVLAANANNTLCAGDPLDLVATITLPSGCLLNGGTPYIFSGPGAPGAIASNSTTIGAAGAGTYTVSVNIADDGTGTCPCTSGAFTIATVGPSNSITVNAAPGAPSLTAFGPVCEGETLTLTANHTSGPSGTFNWYSDPGGTNLVFSGNPFTTQPLSIGDNFYVGESSSGCESGLTAVNPTINPNPADPIAINDTICPDNAAVLSTTLPTGGSAQNWWDSPSGGTQVGSGGVFTTPILAQTTIYYAEAVLPLTGCMSGRTAVTAVVLPRVTQPVAPNIRICEGETGTIIAIGTGTATNAFLWYDVQIGGTPLKITPMPVPPTVPEDTLLVGPFLVGSYAFYVAEYDSITGCESERTEVTVFVAEAVPEPQADDRQICEGDSVTLTANYGAGSNFGDFYWWSDTTGGTLLQIGQNYAPPLSLIGAPGVYDFWVEEQYMGCTSPTRDRVTVTVFANPANPATTTDTICIGQTATITATLGTAGNILEWFADGSGVNLLASGPSYTTSILNQTTTFYVRERNPVMGCESGYVAVTVVVNPLPPLPAAGNVTACENANVIITATGTGNANTRLDLYDATNSLVQTGAIGANSVNFNIGTLGQGTYTYFVEEVDLAGGCSSNRVSLTVTVQAAPANPIVSGVNICSGLSTTLSASSGGGTNGTLSWYADPALTNLLTTGSTYPTPILTATTTYYVTETDGVCEGLPTTVTVTIDPNPTDPAVANDTICTGQSATLTATATIGVLNWYDNASGNTLIFTGASFTTPALNQTTSYWVREQVVGTGCLSNLIQVTAVVNPIPPSPSANAVTVCENEDAIITASGSGTAGNRLDLYTLTGLLVGAGTGGTSQFENFNIGMLPPATYTFLVEEINLASGCASARTAVTVTVLAAPAIPSVTPVSICEGGAATLTAVSGGGTNGVFNWYADMALTNLLSTGSTFAPPALTVTTTYFVTETLNSCESNGFAVTVTVNPNPVSPTVANDTICTGQTASLMATGSGGFLLWYDNVSGNNVLFIGPNFITPTLTQTTTYWVSETNPATGCVSPFVAVTATVGAVPPAPSANSLTVCENANAIIAATGTGVSSQLLLYDASNTLLQSGTVGATNVNFNLGMLSPGVYNFTVEEINTLTGCASARTAVTVTVSSSPAIPSVIPASICEGQQATLSVTSGGGSTGIFNWYSDLALTNLVFTGSAFTTPALNSNTTYYVTEVLNGCESNAFASTVTVNPNPTSPIVTNDTICTGQTAALSATGSGGSLNWYDNASGNTLIFTGANYTTPTLLQSTAYWVQELTVATGCVSPLVPVTAIVNPIPPMPTVSNFTVCENEDVIITASGSGTPGNRLDLYTVTGILVQTGTSSIAQFENFNLGMLPPATYTFQVEEIDLASGCASQRASVTFTVTQAPAIPVVAPVTICTGFSATLNASSAGGTNGSFNWYSDPILANLLFTGTSFTTPVLTANTTYYVTESLIGCESAALAVTVTISSAPADPIVTPDTVCTGQPATVSATSTVGVLNWYDNSSGTNLLATGPTYTTPALTQSTTYWVQEVITGTGCASNLVPVTAVVNPIPPLPSGSSITICNGDSVIFLVSGTGNANTRLNIYNVQSGGTPILSGPTGTSTVQFNLGFFAIGTYTFYLEEEDLSGGCVSARTAINATVSPSPLPPNVSGATICQGFSTTMIATSSGGTQGQFSWYADSLTTNLLFTGAIYTTPVLVANTNFYVTEILGSCESTPTRVTVTVNPTPSDPAVVPANICQGQTASLLAVGAAGNTINWYDNPSASNLLFVGNNFVTPPLNQNTTYYVRQQVPGTGCVSNLVAVTVTILPLPTPPSAGDITICEGDVGIITATGSGVGSLRWYTSATSTTPIRIDGMPPASANLGVGPFAAGVQVFYVDEFNGACASTRTSISVSIIPAPPAPIARDTTICQGTAAVLVARHAGTSRGSFNWYDATGTILIYTGNNFNTGLLNVTTNYLVTEKDSICESAGTSVTVTVDPAPGPPVAVGDTICDGEMGMLSAVGFPGNIISWYDDPNGSNLLFIGANFTTPALNQTTTYYVRQIPVGTGCQSLLAPVTVVVNPLPPTPTATTIRICEGAIGVLTASGTGNPNTQLNWYDNATFTLPIKVSPMPPSSDTLQVGPFVQGTYTYYIEEEDTQTGCKSLRSSVSVIVSPRPLQPSVNDTSICEGNSVTLMAPGVGTFNWYDAPSGGNLLHVGLTFTTPVLFQTTTYYVSLEVNGCESRRETVVVNVQTAPAVPTISSNSPICEGDTLFLFAGTVANVSYMWTGPNGFSSPLQNPIIVNANIVLNQGTYTLVVTDLSSGCVSDPQSLVVSINPRPATPTLQTNSPVCDGDDLELMVAAVSGATYNWSGPGGFLGTTMVPSLTVPAVTISDAGTYQVTVTLNGCPSLPGTASVSIIPPPPKPVASSNTPLCEGDDLMLTATGSGAGQYSWTGPNGFTSNLQSPTIQNITTNQSGDYIVSFLAINGCTNPVMDTVTVVINSRPPTVVVISNSPVCEGDSIELSAPFVPNVSYSWTGPSGFTSSLQNPIIRNIREIDNQGDYTLVITDTTTGCPSDPATVFVDVLPGIPVNLFVVNSGPVCIGRDVQFTASTVPNGTYFWVGPNGFRSNLQNPLLTNAMLADSGVYSVTVTVPGQCLTSATVTTTLVVGSGLPVDAGPDITIREGDNAQLSASGGVIYSWTPATYLSNPNIASPMVENAPTGIYTYIVMASDVGGCNGMDTVIVTVLDGGGNPPVPTPADLGVYDLFTPNGDGLNDTWVIDNIAMLGSYTLSIFDRGGIQILTTTDYNNNWDGTFSGRDLPEGTYWYVIRASIGEIKGAITLIR